MKSNFCKSGGLMVVCSAKNPKECKFFKKNPYHQRCTYQTIELAEDEYHCGCIEARCELCENKKEQEEILYQEIMQGELYE
jgi:hypothetical protein